MIENFFRDYILSFVKSLRSRWILTSALCLPLVAVALGEKPTFKAPSASANPSGRDLPAGAAAKAPEDVAEPSKKRSGSEGTHLSERVHQAQQWQEEYFDILSRHHLFSWMDSDDLSPEAKQDEADRQALLKTLRGLVPPPNPFFAFCEQIDQLENPCLTTETMNQFEHLRLEAFERLRKTLFSELKSWFQVGKISQEDWNNLLKLRSTWEAHISSYSAELESRMGGSASGLVVNRFVAEASFVFITLLVFCLDSLAS